ncbi:IclR family transcriptional regulator [Tamaricihabitans halophyticus]|uniref:Glycerol operon regulatory protein n=1 Tax=Tamaricihabitans halophyticus TaxID=1262583 RepID=A0A4R2R369_9PSEU|nr:IclR family transcriptional regulator [Tamaricihabitans halophyticus]TCP56467.1 IclR family transcriptional regulator [Tamaricihabitans halophyticus]
MAAAHAPDEQHQVGTKDAGNRVQSVDRAVALLGAVSAAAPEGKPAAELAADCGLNRATAWRLLATLEHHGLVERDPLTNRYAIGFEVARLATTASVAGLIRRAHDVLEQLCVETGETANIAVAQRLGLTYVDEVAPPLVLSARWLGRQVPVHATSAGKALLAWLPETEVDAMLTGPLVEYTATTRTNTDTLRTELAQIRAQGYSVSVGEMESQLNGVAAPVLDTRQRPIAVLSVWGPQDRVSEERFPELAARLVTAATEISERLTEG